MGSTPILGTMKRVIIRYNNLPIKVNISHDNTCILDSYKIKSVHAMHEILYMIRDEDELGYMAINKRSIWGMTHEWRAHNLLYALNIHINRTKDVDLDISQPWYYKVAYSVLSLFYPRF